MLETLVKEVLKVLKTALAGWPQTVRLCVILVVVAALIWTISPLHQ